MDDLTPALIQRAKTHADRTAIISNGQKYTYQKLLTASKRAAGMLLSESRDLAGQRVAFLTPRGFDYPVVLWGIWRAGGVAVPLCEVHPKAELAYTLEDCGATVVVSHPDFAATIAPLAREGNITHFSTEDLFEGDEQKLPEVHGEQPAMMLYTSGTTGKPKGVVLTHQNLESQITTLIQAWEWRPKDHILEVLPLHHTHGIVNILCCALWAGAACEMLPKFNANAIWDKFMSGHITLFMAVPTIYVRLMAAWEEASPELRERMRNACARLRLMVSGSAALPATAFQKWQSISGHDLLERYGMTEIGMALSNPLHGRRKPGYVGAPLPGVTVRIVDEAGQEVPDGTSGEIEVSGPAVFKEYWQRPGETRNAFRGQWFRTGDVAVVEGGCYRILGRQSTDIIKTGGYKVSALEIEEILRSHPHVRECAVVGREDPEWGERVCAAVVLEAGAEMTLPELRKWGKPQMAPYKLPVSLEVLKALPRNAMGKVTKPTVKELLK